LQYKLYIQFHQNNDQVHNQQPQQVASFHVAAAVVVAAPHPTFFLFFLVEYSNIRILFH